MGNFGLRMRRNLAMLLVCFLIAGLFPSTIFANEAQGFSDINGHWAEQSINNVVKEGLFKGNAENAFDPQGSMTRGMFITVLQRLADKLEGPEVVVSNQTFSDVPDNAWYANAINWAVSAGLTNGYGNGAFGPNDHLDREQITVLMVRFLTTYLGYDLSSYETSSSFADDAQISSWAKAEVYQAVALGLVQGEKGNVFNPKGVASRAVVAVIAERFLEKASVLKAEKQPQPTEEPEQTPAPSEAPDLGGGGGDYTGGSSKVKVTAATIQRDRVEVSNGVITSGDVLSVAVKPANASTTVKWLINGKVKSTEKTYTVQALDVGAVITAEVTGTGNYTSTVTSLPTGKVLASVDLSNQDQNSSPVVVAEDATFKDEEGNDVTLSETDVLSFSVTASEAEFTEAEKDGVATKIQEQFADAELDVDALSIHYFAIDAQLLVESENNESKIIHPVGKTTLTLSKASLGYAADDDISKHVFLIGHTNKAGDHENVIGEVVELNGEQYVRVELNGLSTIYIGNVPPLTVSFNTNGGSEIAPVKVKLGEITPEVTAPTKAGHFFLGWNTDLNASPIFRDITFDALWLEGSYFPEERLTVVDAEENIIEKQYAASSGTLTLGHSESTEYPAGLMYTLQIEAPENAAFYVLSDVAEAAASATIDDAEAVEGPLVENVEITDDAGKVITGKYPYFVKWFDADGTALLLESVTIAVETDARASTREKMFDVKRGIGTVEAYLLPTGEVDEEYVAYLNGYLSGDGLNDSYILALNASFDKYKYFDSDNIAIDYNNYNTFKLVFTPFEGASYAGKKPTAKAGYWDGNKYQSIDLVAAVTEAGVIEVTLPAGKTLQDITVNSTSLFLDINVTLENVMQTVSLFIHDFKAASQQEESKTISTDNWEEVVAALNEVTEQDVYIQYYGEAVELNSSITVQETQYLFINNNLTIASGGELRVVGGVVGNAGRVSVNGNLKIGDAGKLTAVKKGNLSGTYYIPGIHVSGSTTFEQGSVLSVASKAMFSLYSTKGVYADAGSTFDILGELWLEGGLVLNTNVNVAGLNSRIEVRGDLTINGLLEASEDGSISVSGMTTISDAAELRLTKGHMFLHGKTYNYGKVAMKEGSITFSNIGFAVNNYGVIDLGSKAAAELPGTTLVNNGTITGSGTLRLSERSNAGSRYDNGIDYVVVEGEQSLSNYSRYQFVKDPQASVNAIIYESKVSGTGTVSNTIKVNEIKIPQ